MTKSDGGVRVPSGLKATGRALWDSTVDEFDLSGHELTLLGQACRAADRCESLENVIRRDGIMAKGSTGQPVVNPAVQEARQQQAVLASLIRALGLPEPEEESGSAVTPLKSVEPMQQRTAGLSRWAKSHG